MTELNHEQVPSRMTESMGDLTSRETVTSSDQSKAEDMEWWYSLLRVRPFHNIESEYKFHFETREITRPATAGEMVALIRKQNNHG